MHNIKCLIAYDGTHYLGWQKTKTGNSIEGTLEAAIETCLQHPVHLQAASRTDARVHANGQVVNFLTSKTLDLGKLRSSLNHVLPKDIVILSIEQMSEHFHPTLDCIAKEYRYFICHGTIQLPEHRLYSWHVSNPLSLSLIRDAMPTLIGLHDFSTFSNTKKNEVYQDHTREIHLLELIEIEQERFYFRVKGNHFLYKMVRNIVGTLIDIGRGKIAADALKSILQSKSRPEAGITAPPHGLFLHEVIF